MPPIRTSMSPRTFDEGHPSPMSGRPQKAKTQPRQEKIKRPPNAWILYRAEKSPLIIANYPDKKFSQSELSQMISRMWKTEDPDVQAEYSRKAAQEAVDHRLKYPDYKYQPMSKEEKARQKQREKSERMMKKHLEKKAKVPEPTPPPATYVPPQLEPYQSAAQYGTMGPSPPYSSGSLPSSASSPSVLGDVYDHIHLSLHASSSSNSHASSPPSSLPSYRTLEDHSAPSTVKVGDSASTSRVPSSSTVVYHPSPVPSSAADPPPQYEWPSANETPVAPQPAGDVHMDAPGGHVATDASEQPLFDEQFPFDDFLNPPSAVDFTNSLTLDLPAFNGPNPWNPEFDDLQLGALLNESWNHTVYTLPDLNLQSLETTNALQVNVMPESQPEHLISAEEAASLANYLLSLQGPKPEASSSQSNRSSEAAVQDQQRPTTGSMDEVFSFSATSGEQHQIINFDNFQFYPTSTEDLHISMPPQQIDPAQLMITPPSSNHQQQHPVVDPSPTSSNTSSSYTPPPGAARAGARRVAGSWRPPQQFRAPTPPTNTPQYLSPMSTASSWNATPN